MRDSDYLFQLQALFEWLHAEVETRVQAGQSLDEIRSDLDFSGQSARFTGGDEWLESRFRVWFATPILEATYNEIMGIDNEPLEASEE